MWYRTILLYIASSFLLSLLQSTVMCTWVILDLLHLNSTLEQFIDTHEFEAFPESLSQWDVRYGINGSELKNTQKTALTRDQFMDIINAVRDIQYKDITHNVINASYQTNEALNKLFKDQNFVYAKKLTIPINSIIYCWGDVHGDIVALLSVLAYLKKQKIINNNFKILQPNTYIIPCGDFVDRGLFGVEVLYILCTLKQVNPEQVFLVRGNHEDLTANLHNSFQTELAKKFDIALFYSPQGKKILASTFLPAFYDSLPCVLYLRAGEESPKPNYVQFCHGGLEFHTMNNLLTHKNPNAIEIIERLDRRTIANQILPQPNDPRFSKFIDYNANLLLNGPVEPTPSNIGFMWSDFKAAPGSQRRTTSKSARGGYNLIFGNLLTQALIEFSGGGIPITAVIRGHQHNEDMPQLIHQQENHNIYKLLQKDLKATIITNVLSAPYHNASMMPSRGFMKIEAITSNTTAWLLTGIWQPNEATTAEDWHESKRATLISWKNAVD